MRFRGGFLLALAWFLAPTGAPAATFTVTNTSNAGPGSLRQAILNANGTPGFDIIEFNIPGCTDGVMVIQPVSALPTITEAVAINAGTEPCPTATTPTIVLSGALVPPGADGLTIAAPQSSISRLVIHSFSASSGSGGNGIVLDHADSSIVQDCLIGTDPSGMYALGNGGAGILFSDTISANVSYSLISGNATGVVFAGSSQYSGVSFCLIGTNKMATAALGNAGDGVAFSGASRNNTVDQCFVSGNGGNGISVAATASGSISGTRIGVAAGGISKLPNALNGVLVNGSNASAVGPGNLNSENRNQISGNGGDGVRLVNASFVDVNGNDIGLDADGTAPLGNGGNGITIEGGSNNHIGFVARNAVSGNDGNGIELRTGTTGNFVVTNSIGTNSSGTAAVANAGDGIRIVDASSNRFGGLFGTPGGVLTPNNLISGNGMNGIRMMGSSHGNDVLGCFIGLTFDGSGSLPNGANGVAVETGADGNFVGNGIGSFIENNSGAGVWIASNGNSVIGNKIRGNAGAGIFVVSGTGNRLNSSIYANGALGIDLAPAGVTPNDPDDLDTGANQLQNFPTLASATQADGSTHVIGSLTSTPGTTFTVIFRSSHSCDPSGYGPGEDYIDALGVTTDASGIGIFDVLLGDARGPFMTATAMDSAGNTSEFSNCVMIPGPTIAGILPTSGDAGSAVTLTGTGFQSSPSVSFGGVVSLFTSGIDATHARAIAPDLPHGALYDVTLANYDGLSATLPHAWLADFLDVDGSHPLHDFVEKLVRHSVAAGCGLGNFCVDDSVTRAQVAVFLLRAHDGPSYVPSPATGLVFTDVPANGFAAAWIEELAARGVTSGCGGGAYCPGLAMTRAQMAVFLLRAKDGSTYVPPDATGIFADVPATSPYARWVEELFHEGVTAGCGGGNFCPDGPNTRGQMAVFLVTMFGL